MDSIPNGTLLTGKLSARNWPAQFGGRGSVQPALPTPINTNLQPTVRAGKLIAKIQRRREQPVAHRSSGVGKQRALLRSCNHGVENGET